MRAQVGLKPNPEVGYSGQQLFDENSAGQNGPYVTQTFAEKLRQWANIDRVDIGGK